MSGFDISVIQRFDALVAHHTEALFAGVERLAFDADLDAHDMVALFRQRCGDMDDVYSEWLEMDQ